MRRFIIIAAFLALFTSAALAANAVWDVPAGGNCDTSFTRSNANLTVTSSVGLWRSCRATTSHSTGKYFLRYTVIASSNQTLWLSGFENSSADTANYPGSTGSTGIGCQGAAAGSGAYFGTTGGDANCGNGNFGSAIVEYAIDLDAKKIWIRIPANSSQWNHSATADPATGTNGATYSISGALFPACGAHDAAGNGCVLDTTGGTPPSGFLVWDVPAHQASGWTLMK